MTVLAKLLGRAQRGLVYNPPHGIFAAISLADHGHSAAEEVMASIQNLDQAAAHMAERTRMVVGFAPSLWSSWYGALPPGAPPDDSILEQSTQFRATGRDLWLFLKSERPDNCRSLLESFTADLGDLVAGCDTTYARQRSDRKILDHHFYDGITSPSDPVTLGDAVLIRDGDDSSGGCWAFTQAFDIDWARFSALSIDHQVDIIGRDSDAVLIPDDYAGSHVRRARVFDEDRSNPKLLRLSMPFGSSSTGRGREEGIYFTAYARDASLIERIMRSMLGADRPGPADDLLTIVQGTAGGYWYIPSAAELALPDGLDVAEFDLDPLWATRSRNGLMFYNSNDYLFTMATGRYQPGDAPTPRILKLLAAAASRWRDNWYAYIDIPRIPHLRDFLAPDEQHLLSAPVAVRMGMAVKKSLTEVHTNTGFPQTPDHLAWQEDVFRIDPDDVLFGVMPELSLGRGVEVMPYLRDEERYRAMLLGLSEAGAMGHIVPDHRVVLELGIGRLIEDIAARRDAADGDDRRDFYQGVIYALQGVQGYCENWALLAERTAAVLADGDRRANLLAVAARARKLATASPESFLEAVQLVFTMHCCLHLTGNPVAVGRLDQLLGPFHDRVGDGPEAPPQEVLDAFWVKLGEKAIHNRHVITDHNAPGMTAVAYSSDGNFPQGGAINQWVQQVTVGGYLPTADAEPVQASNAVTLLCLRAARRLPLNAPCLSLRVHRGMPDDLIEEAARAILSGGAHPILFQDDDMVAALHEFSGFPLDAARNYACDGCYEPMIAGATEFAFGNIRPLDILEASLNEGATWGIAGPEYLRGTKMSFRSPPARDIETFEQLKETYLQHLDWLCVQFFHGVLVNYGNLHLVCPNVLLSALIDGCLESGRDLTNAGARYHMLAPMFVGMATTIDSLYAVKKLVFDDDAVTTLPELVECLMSDWGFALQEPWQSTLAGSERAALRAKRFRDLREKALALPKFGTGDSEVDEIAAWLVDSLCLTAKRVLDEPPPGLREVIEGIVSSYSLLDRPFRFHLTPGVGTFEGYVGDGLSSGASADGRRAGQPYPSDFSPAPVPQDLPPIAQEGADARAMNGYRDVYRALASWRQPPICRIISNAAPVDMNIREDFPLEDLVELIRRFCDGEVGSNLLTITCADPATYQLAAAQPERFELVRVRMGGWSEFFSAMFPAHQDQHARRPFFVPSR